MSHADGASQVLIDPAASPSEEAPASADQAAADAATGEDVVQDASVEKSPTDGSGFQAVEQSSIVQHTAQRLDVPQQTQILHVCLGSLPDMHASCKAFYFLRSQSGRLAIEDMDTQIDCGILSEGPSLKMLQQVMPGFHAFTQQQLPCSMLLVQANSHSVLSKNTQDTV